MLKRPKTSAIPTCLVVLLTTLLACSSGDDGPRLRLPGQDESGGTAGAVFDELRPGQSMVVPFASSFLVTGSSTTKCGMSGVAGRA